MAPPGTTLAERPVREVWTVSRLNLEVRALLESGFGRVWIEGELSNFAHPRSGHMYFSLKDSGAQVRCAMFRGQNRSLGFVPDNGQQVLARGRVGLYVERGEFQLVIDYMEEAGEGALRRAFEALKARLGAQGLFATERKRALPHIPNRVGVITSPTGAAVRDVLTTLARRFPGLPVVIYPVPVQGEQAAPAIVRMLEVAAARGECDVLILTRGGGSLEDLWAFNDEALAHAIAACPIPVVSAVGHEVDFTIADFVADARAATPTAAAELVSPDGAALADRIAAFRGRLQRRLRHQIDTARRHVQLTSRRLVHPRTRIQELAQRADVLLMRMQAAVGVRISRRRLAHATLNARLHRHHPATRLEAVHARHAQLAGRLRRAVAEQFQKARARHAELARALRTVGPQATLARGYAIVLRADRSAALRSANESAVGEPLVARLADGELEVRVEAVRPGSGAARD